MFIGLKTSVYFHYNFIDLFYKYIIWLLMKILKAKYIYLPRYPPSTGITVPVM